MNMENQFLQAALGAAALGCYVFPVKVGAKSPAFPGWQQMATNDPEKIRQLWAGTPYNIGISCEASRLFVIDYDKNHREGADGCTVRDQWRNSHPWPNTWAVRTPKGGLHEYFKIPDGSPVPQQTAGLYGCVDTRSAGGYVLAPGSMIDSKAYTWENHPVIYPLSDFSPEIQNFLSAAPERQSVSKPAFQLPAEILEGQRTSALIALIGSLRAKGLNDESIRAAVYQENAEKCNPPLTDDELESMIFPALSRQWAATASYTKDAPIDSSMLDALKSLDVVNNKRYPFTDNGAARLFVDVCGSCTKFLVDRGRWLSYDGRRWDQQGGDSRARELARSLADALVQYSISIQDENLRTNMLKFATRWQTLHFRQTVLSDASTIAPLTVADFDSAEDLLTVQNGVLDLKTGELLPHSPAHKSTKITGAAFDPAATCARWLSFVDEVTGGDQELAQYLQKAFGYSLGSSKPLDCFFILYGPTSRNGKSTLVDVISSVMGDYGTTCSPDTLTKRKFANGSGPSEDVFRLCAIRFLSCAELPRGMEMNTSLMKQLTGGDTMTARNLREGSIEFKPQFSLYLHTNHLPRIDDISIFSSGRVKILPFTQHFSEQQRDPELRSKLTTPEAKSAVLNWLLDGWRMVQSEGLQEPEAVKQATGDYKNSEDKVSLFLSEACEATRGEWLPVADLHNRFALWCSENGFQSNFSVSKFRDALIERGYSVSRKRPVGAGRGANPLACVMNLKLLQGNS